MYHLVKNPWCICNFPSPTKDLHACMGVSIKKHGSGPLLVHSGGIPEAIGETDETGFIVNISWTIVLNFRKNCLGY